jgi:hypothetical protein
VEQTLDPATYLFHKAICEHALMKREEATHTANRLLKDAVCPPRRYTVIMVMVLMDMETWQKDLGNVARLMENSERRLEIGRGGKQTQKIQMEIINRLDEMIKQLENDKKGDGSDGKDKDKDDKGRSCPSGGKGDAGKGDPGQPGNVPAAPLPDSQIVQGTGTGDVDIARLKKLAENWGNLPQAERAQAMQEMRDLVATLSPMHRQAMERYFERINDKK